MDRLQAVAFLCITGCFVGLLVSCSRQVDQEELPPSFHSFLYESTWLDLLQKTPITYTTPQPNPNETVIDGLYAKIDPSVPQAWLCRRCADYRPAGGIWRLQFEKGVMRIFYEVTGWRSIASFVIDGDHLYLFNDPYCPDIVGAYVWEYGQDVLSLSVVNDECSIRLRGKNLSKQAWEMCDLDGEWVPGCTATSVEFGDVSPPPGIQVIVHPGDSRFFERPPEIILPANDVEAASQKGIQLLHSEASIGYGLNRILWWGGNWMETRTEGTYRSYGVQFLGDPQIGWARIYFDGVEVWRGDTSDIWSQFGRFGGFVEILSDEAGPHTLRVESLDMDYRPVTVAGFGFSRQDGVIAGDPGSYGK